MRKSTIEIIIKFPYSFRKNNDRKLQFIFKDKKSYYRNSKLHKQHTKGKIMEEQELQNLTTQTQIGAGMRDVIGLDVLRLTKKVETKEEALKILAEMVNESFEIINSDDSTFVIRTSVADLNSVNGVVPEDLEAAEAIPIQVKISEMLSAQGLDVGINEDAKEEILAAAEKAKAENTETEK